MSEARRLWRAMGFADVGDDVPVFTDADVTALRLVSSLRRRGMLDLETTVHLTRALGRMTGRLVEWQLQTLVERIAADGVAPELAFRAGVEQAATLTPELEQLLVYVWRRKLAAPLTGRCGTPTRTPSWTRRPWGSRISWAMRLARRLPESELAAVVETFEARTSDIVAAAGGRVVKTFGDEVLFLAGPPAVGADIGLQISAAMRADPILPDAESALRRERCCIGWATSSGPPSTSPADSTTWPQGQVYVDSAMAAALDGDPGYRVRRAWMRPAARCWSRRGLVAPSARMSPWVRTSSFAATVPTASWPRSCSTARTHATRCRQQWPASSGTRQELAADAAVRAVVLSSSNEPAFCVGADLKERNAFSDADLLRSGCTTAPHSAACSTCRCPRSRRLRGTRSAAASSALSCDLIVADESAVVGLPEVTVGVIPGGGGTQLVARRIGASRAADLIFTGRRLDIDEARPTRTDRRRVPPDLPGRRHWSWPRRSRPTRSGRAECQAGTPARAGR